MRSTINDIAVWPAIEATEKIATPIKGTIWVWIAIKLPPRDPANSFHRAIFFCEIAVRRFLIPALIFELNSVIVKMMIKPEPNEITAACKPLSRR